MSKSSTATLPKNPLPVKSAWSKGPPLNTATSSPRSQSPAPSTPSTFQPSHSRRPSALGQQGVPIKDGVSIPRSNVGHAKQGSSVTFGSIDDVAAPISSSPAAIPALKSKGVESFGSVPAATPQVNGKSSSVTMSKPSTTQPASISGSSTPASPAPAKIHLNKMDIKKMFQNPTSSPSPPLHTASATSSPSVRPTGLPLQPTQQGQPSTVSTTSPPLSGHSYSTFTPQNGARPPQQNAQPGGPSSGPRSPVYQRQPMANGNGPRTPGGPNGPGGPPQMQPGLSSPRLSAHPHPGPPQGMPPQMPPQFYPSYYYVPPEQQQHYMYPQPWYGMPQHQMPPQHQPPHQQPHQHPLPGAPPHTGIPVSPRNPPPPLQGPGTPTSSHAIATPHTPHPPPLPHSAHSNTSSIGGMSNISSPPPTPSTASSARLNTAAPSFVPSTRSKISFKNPDGTEATIDALKSKVGPSSANSVMSPPATTTSFASPNNNRRSVIKIEDPSVKEKRLAEEAEKEKKAKAVVEEKARKEKEDKERKEKEEAEKKEKEEAEKKRIEEEAKEKERLRLEEEEKVQQRKLEEEKERLLKEEEERKKREEEEAALKEKERLQKEEEAKEKLRKEEEKERVRKEEEEASKAKALTEESESASKASETKVSEPPATEEGEVVDSQESGEVTPVKSEEVESKDKLKEKEGLRIDTASELPKRRPGPLNLSTTLQTNIPAALPSALATARIIDDLGLVPYPEGVKSPMVELNLNAKDGKFRYDRDFLLQFMSVCKEKPDMLPPLDAIGLEPTDQASFAMSRGGSGRHRQGSGASAPQRQASVGLGFAGGSAGFGKAGAANPFSMGNFGTMGATKLSSEQRFDLANSGRSVSTSGAPGLPFGRPGQMTRTASQGGPGSSSMGSNRTRSKRGEKRNDGNKVSSGGGGQSSHNNYNQHNNNNQSQFGLEPVAPLQATQNRWDRKTVGAVDPESPELVDRKVKGLLNKLTMEKFDTISDQIIEWANRSEKEKDGRTLIQVIRLVFEKATDEAAWSEMYARLCRKMMEQISPKVQDDGIKNSEGKPIAGGQLFRKYLLNRCQEDFERGWVAKEATAAAAAAKSMEDEAAKVASEKAKNGEDEIVLYSEEYYAAQKAKRQGLGLIKFIGELFKLQMLTERIMHECVKKLLGNVENPEEEEIESLCKLLITVGAILDTTKARAHMDVYFSRMKELTKSLNVSSRMQFMLQDVLELRERRWITRTTVAAPTTIAAVHEAAAKEKAAQEKESYQRQMSMSRGGSRRGGDRGDNFQQVGPDGWAVAGGNSGAPRPPPKAGDLSNFGKISSSSKGAPMTFGPSSVFSAKKESKGRETLSRANSSQNMFSMLSQNADAPAEATPAKSSRPPSRKTSVDLTQAGAPEPAQRRRLVLQPRSKPVEENSTPATDSADGSEDDAAGEDAAVEMSEAEAKKKIDEDLKEFFAVRNLEEAEEYFTKLPAAHHPTLVDKLVSSALESKAADATLVSEFFTLASSKDLCTLEAFEEGFNSIVEFLDDVVIDAPKALDLMAVMLKGPRLTEEQRTRIANKSVDSGAKLLELLS